MKHPWWLALMPVAALMIRLLGRTLRCTYINLDVKQTAGELKPAIVAVWHGRMFYFAYHYRDQAFPALMSLSTGGEIIARAGKSLRYHPIRGSSSRGGAAAFRELLRCLKAGRKVGITPDGPLGPPCRAQPGIIYLARAAGVPILPASFAARRQVEFNSWDRFIVPLPFSRVTVVFGEPMEVGPDDDVEAARLVLEERMNEINRLADAAVGR